MMNAEGIAITLRLRMGPGSADRSGGLVDPSRILALFGDVAAELMIRIDGDEGILRSYQQVELLAPVFVGDYVEATGVITRASGSTRQIAFEARKVIAAVRANGASPTAADALASPVVVGRALGTCIVPRAQQRHPKLVLPAFPAPGPDGARLPEGHAIVTPPPHVVVTPPRSTPPEIILAASIVGGGVTRDHSPHIPVSAEEIAQEAKRCRDAGAAVVHLGFDATSASSIDEFVARAREVVDAVHGACDALVAVSTLAPGAEAPELRAALADIGADVVSITTGSCNFGDGIVENPRSRVRQTASSLRDRNARVLCECLELGHLDEAVALARERLIAQPLRLQFVLGIPGALGAHDEVVRFLASRIPKGAVWFAAGVGRFQRPVTEAAARSGGHVRLGLADNLFLKRGVLAESSAVFIERAAAFARSIGRDPVAPARARAILRFDAAAPAESGETAEPTAVPSSPAAEASQEVAEQPSSPPSEVDDKSSPSS